MLGAFRWNLRVLSYVALIVGAFLIYNTISVSVVRRRAEIGAVRALGASRRAVMLAFLAEAAAPRVLPAPLAGLPLGRAMASAAVGLIGATVNALYVSSTPGPDHASPGASSRSRSAIGVGVAVVSALSPAREAALVSPIDAMGRGRRDFVIRVHRFRDLALALLFGAAAVAAAQSPPINGMPLFGYVSAILSVAACGLAIPALVSALASRSSRAARPDARRRGTAGRAQPLGLAAPDVGARRGAGHRGRDDDIGRHHGRAASAPPCSSGSTASSPRTST